MALRQYYDPNTGITYQYLEGHQPPSFKLADAPQSRAVKPSEKLEEKVVSQRRNKARKPANK